jgi:hypothetical protein
MLAQPGDLLVKPHIASLTRQGISVESTIETTPELPDSQKR